MDQIKDSFHNFHFNVAADQSSMTKVIEQLRGVTENVTVILTKVVDRDELSTAN